MNLVEILSRELRGKNLTDLEKARYIYLRCCEIFSFDARWNFFTLFSQETIQKIESKIFDITNISSPLVICHTFSKSILKPLLEEFTSLPVIVLGDNHSYVSFVESGKKWNLDGTLGDFPRVKLGLKVEGFQLDEHEFSFGRMDHSLGYSYVPKSNYMVYDWETGYEYMNQVGEIIQASKCKYQYSDVVFLYNYMTYLMRQDSRTILDENQELCRKIHFTENEEDYILHKVNGEYCLELENKRTL